MPQAKKSSQVQGWYHEGRDAWSSPTESCSVGSIYLKIMQSTKAFNCFYKRMIYGTPCLSYLYLVCIFCLFICVVLVFSMCFEILVCKLNLIVNFCRFLILFFSFMSPSVLWSPPADPTLSPVHFQALRGCLELWSWQMLHLQFLHQQALWSRPGCLAVSSFSYSSRLKLDNNESS
jgi:hypothetical protein